MLNLGLGAADLPGVGATAATLSPDLRAQHDLLLAFQPAGADHGSHNCPVCAAAEGAGDEEGTLTTYTDEQAQEMVAAAVAAAVAPLRTELDGLRSAATADEHEAAIADAVAAAVAPLEEQLTAVRTERDAATADLNAVTSERDDLVAERDAAATAAQEAADLESRTKARVDAIGEVAKFTDEQIAARSAEWAAMDESSFGILVETLKSSAVTGPRPYVRPSALTAAETPPAGADAGSTSVMGAALAAARTGSARRNA